MLLPSPSLSLSSPSSSLSPSSFVIKEPVIQQQRHTHRANNFKGVFSMKVEECVFWGTQRMTPSYLRTRGSFLEPRPQQGRLDAGTLAGRARPRQSPRDRSPGLPWTSAPSLYRCLSPCVVVLFLACPASPLPFLTPLVLLSGIKLLVWKKFKFTEEVKGQ